MFYPKGTSLLPKSSTGPFLWPQGHRALPPEAWVLGGESCRIFGWGGERVVSGAGQGPLRRGPVTNKGP